MRSARQLCLLLLCSLLAGCATTGVYRESPHLVLESIRPIGKQAAAGHYLLLLTLENRNDRDMRLASLSYNIELNRQPFAYGLSRQSITIPAQGAALLEIEVVNSAPGLVALQAASRRSLEYRISGRIGLENSADTLPYDYTGELLWQAPREGG